MSTTRADMLSVRLYMKPGCHLCEEAEATLESLRPRYAHTLERIDISSDAELRRRYGEIIPVLVLGGVEYAAPLSRASIEQAFYQATQVTSTQAARASSVPSTTQAHTTPNREPRPQACRFPWSNPRGR
jgi:glutaredoxin